ncbi:TRAP transporter substrate-binding protein [Bowmanella pacifica]|uniref:C4-dicarboxylate ABC transporter n=1 Tax=Bowmanella pacifica TaxID=502051 RepID=A0A917YTR2_9ALTE|nr:TRAP transporter substrate-binding protein [Bowmanella pacifica]GGO64179.1 C4-dicarboxylate ABC transporter [Bowmanella pacifica]
MKWFYSACLAGATALALLGCGKENIATDNNRASQQTFEWKLVTSWPKNFPGLGRGPETFAQMVQEMSGGRLKVKVYGAGELVPGFEVFDAVSNGTAQMGHAGSYYWKGKAPAAQIFTAIPFGMNVTETNSWLHYGGGLALWREVYKPFGVIPFAGGNTGVQMAGWFNKEIHSIEDLKGLKIRMPGLGAEVLKKVGAIPVALTGGEIFTALQTGAIDATEWVGPYNDLSFGLHKAADYYYYSGWHEPGAMLEFTVNESAYNSLPADLQHIVAVATRAVNQDMLDEYTARNHEAMAALKDEHGIKVLPLPKDVMLALRAASLAVMQEQAAKDPQFAKVYASYSEFQKKVSAYHELSEMEYYKNRQAEK